VRWNEMKAALETQREGKLEVFFKYVGDEGL
jgi:hypothetical protein